MSNLINEIQLKIWKLSLQLTENIIKCEILIFIKFSYQNKTFLLILLSWGQYFSFVNLSLFNY